MCNGSKSLATSQHHTSQPTSHKSPFILQSQARSLPWPTSSTSATNDYFPSPTPVALKTRLRTSQLPSDATPPRRLTFTPPTLSPYTPPQLLPVLFPDGPNSNGSLHTRSSHAASLILNLLSLLWLQKL